MNSPGFCWLFALTQAVGLAVVAMVAAWTTVCRGGFTWTGDPELQFNWHPLLNAIGMVYLFANSILVYRSLRSLNKKSSKLIHASVLVAVGVLASVGFVAVFQAHNRMNPPKANFYSLHSWSGTATGAIFLLQWVFGFTAFLYPGFSPRLRALVLPYHSFMGLLAFVFAIATALTGLKEKSKPSGQASSDGETYLINATGLTLMLFGALVVYLATRSGFKRAIKTTTRV